MDSTLLNGLSISGRPFQVTTEIEVGRFFIGRGDSGRPKTIDYGMATQYRAWAWQV